MFDNRRKGLISALIYPVQFERNPVDGVDRVLELIARGRALDGSPEEYADAVGAALRSDEPLASLIPQGHSESAIRTYLAELGKRLPIDSAGEIAARTDD